MSDRAMHGRARATRHADQADAEGQGYPTYQVSLCGEERLESVRDHSLPLGDVGGALTAADEPTSDSHLSLIHI